MMIFPLTTPAPKFPWITLEAESMVTTGIISKAEGEGKPGFEAAENRYVTLTKGKGDLSFVVPPMNFNHGAGLVVRFSFDQGTGTLPVYRNGKRVGAVPITAEFSHQFGAYPFTKKPEDGHPRHFWDEASLVLDKVKSGDRISLRWEGPGELRVDLVDIEPIPAIVPPPVNAIPFDGKDFGVAVKSAALAHRPLYIGPGTYLVGGETRLDSVQIVGAGSWYSTLKSDGRRVTLLGDGNQISVSGLSIRSNVTYRNDSEPNDGVSGSFGRGSSLRDLWIEHSKVGMWLTNSVGLRVEGCRFRNTIADGINLCLGMQGTTVLGCSARGTGDDGFAMWPATYAPAKFAHQSNVFKNCLAELPFLAQGFSIYGGRDQSVIGCEARNIPYGAGFYASTTFPTADGFSGTTLFSACVAKRTGIQPALALFADQRDLPNVRVEGLDLAANLANAILFSSANGHRISNASFASLASVGDWSSVFNAKPGCLGDATVNYGGPPNVREYGQFKLEFVRPK